MRLRRLDVIRYGHFTDAALELPAGARDLHIVFGPNEAGKSTALSAFEDLLFGIPHNSPLNFVHDYNSMRIGAVLEDEQGGVIEVRRRKGNKGTLLAPDGAQHPAGDGALLPFLAGVDRDFVERMFSLDHTRLRQGGQEILQARDDVGEALFSSAAGLSGLRDRLKALSAEADNLWAPRRAKHRRYFEAEDRLKEASSELRDRSVAASKWQQLKRAYDSRQEAYDALAEEIEQATADQRKLTRIRRVFRHIRTLEETEQAIADLGEVISLPEDAARTLEGAERDDANAATQIETHNKHLEKAQEERSLLTFDAALGQRNDDIEKLHERRINVRRGRDDLPKRYAELAHHEADLQQAAAELEWGSSDLTDVAARIPPRSKVAAARKLLNTRGARVSAAENTRSTLEDAEAAVRELEEELERLDVPVDMSKLEAVLKASPDAGELGARVDAAVSSFEDAEAALNHVLISMKPGVANASALEGLSVPPKDTVQSHRDALRSLEERAQGCREKIRAAENELEINRNASERLATEESAVAPEELARARQHRGSGWSLIRRRYVVGASLNDDELRAFAESEDVLAEKYEAAVEAADSLADRRFEKAEAAGQLSVYRRQFAEQNDKLQALKSDLEAYEEEGERLATTWKEMWSKAPFEPLDPDTMLEWLTRKDEALAAGERRATAERRLAALREQEASAKAIVLTELAELGMDIKAYTEQQLAVVREAAADTCRQNEKAAEKKRQAQEAHRKAKADATRRQTALEKADADLTEWNTEWAAALSALGLDAAVSPDAVSAQMDAIEEMRTLVGKINDLRHERIGKIERDTEAFNADVTAIVNAVAPDLAEVEPEEAVLELERRLAEAKRVQNLQKEKDSTIKDLEKSIADCEEARRGSLEVIASLQNTAGVDNLDELKRAIASSDRLRELKAKRDEVSATLGEEGDGFPVEQLRLECRDVDLDQVSARASSLEQDLEELRARQLDVRDERSAARTAFEAVGGDDAAARAAAARQEALAEMRETAEQYVRLRSSAILLQWAIDRFRREKQAPLLKRAGELFATLTQGSFSNLSVDFDDQDEARLIGVRPNGRTVGIAGMSTGTADQLYLALRIASIFDYVERATPFPFIADDLFINFDDERAAASFEVLGQLAASTQVLFFTHHQHLVDIARSTLGGSVSVISFNDETLEKAV